MEKYRGEEPLSQNFKSDRLLDSVSFSSYYGNYGLRAEKTRKRRTLP